LIFFHILNTQMGSVLLWLLALHLAAASQLLRPPSVTDGVARYMRWLRHGEHAVNAVRAHLCRQ
jgi:hypothetical protein